MATVLLTGSGPAWLQFSSLWGSLPFKVALPQQAALTLILLMFNRRLCRTNMAIQFAYAGLAARIKRRLRRLAPLALLRAYHRLLVPVAAGRTCSAAVLAAPKEAAEAVRAACMASATATATAAAAAAAARSAALQAAAGSRAAAAATAAAGAELCLQYQPLRCGPALACLPACPAACMAGVCAALCYAGVLRGLPCPRKRLFKPS